MSEEVLSPQALVDNRFLEKLDKNDKESDYFAKFI